jgi:hypothetical protein
MRLSLVAFVQHTDHHFIKSTVEVKQGCPLSPTLFGICTNELESFLHEHIQPSDGYLLYYVPNSRVHIPFANDVVLLASPPKGLQRQLDALSIFRDLQELMVSLGKTKVMIFNCSKKTLPSFHFYFKGKKVEITTTYTYPKSHSLATIRFSSNSHFSMRFAIRFIYMHFLEIYVRVLY